MERCDYSFRGQAIGAGMNEEKIELKRIDITMDLSWTWAAGEHFTRFFSVLEGDGKILGIRCPKCRRVYLPPRPMCGDCHEKLGSWVPLKETGTVAAYTVCHYKLLNPETGKPRITPFGIALIQLDGADTTINHYIEESDLSQLRIGARVEAVLRESRQGNVSDIRFFKLL